MKVLVIYNANSGLKNQVEQLKLAFQPHHADVTFLEINRNLSRAIETAVKHGCKTIVAAGGDGTVNAVASRVVGTPLRLGIIPLGTLNHFAKDLELPLNIEAAVDVILNGHSKKVDVAEVNQHIFINNSSIGIYPAMVRERQRHQSWLGKWPSALLALIKVMAIMRRYHVVLKANGEIRKFRTPFIFVGNNSYRLRKIGFTNRGDLTAGKLSVYWVTTKNPLRIAHIFLRSLLGRAHRDKDFESLLTSEIKVTFRRSRLTVAFDGEIKVLRTPLQYRSRPGSLRVLIPSRVK